MSLVFDIKNNKSLKEKIVKAVYNGEDIFNVITYVSKALTDKKNRIYYDPFREIFKDKYDKVKNYIDQLMNSDEEPYIKGEKLIELIKKENMYDINNLEHINNGVKVFFTIDMINDNSKDSIEISDSNDIFEENIYRKLYNDIYATINDKIDFKDFLKIKEKLSNIIYKYLSLNMNNTLNYELKAIFNDLNIDNKDIDKIASLIKTEFKNNKKLITKYISRSDNNLTYNLQQLNNTDKLFDNIFPYKRNQYQSIYGFDELYNIDSFFIYLYKKIANIDMNNIAKIRNELLLFDSGFINEISDETKNILNYSFVFANLIKDPKFIKIHLHLGTDELNKIIELGKKLNLYIDSNIEKKIKKHLMPYIYRKIDENETKFYGRDYFKDLDIKSYINFINMDITENKFKGYNEGEKEERSLFNGYIMNHVKDNPVAPYFSMRLRDILGEETYLKYFSDFRLDNEKIENNLNNIIDIINKNITKYSNNEKDKIGIKFARVLEKLRDRISKDNNYFSKNSIVRKQVEELIKKSTNIDYSTLVSSVDSIINQFNRDYVTIINEQDSKDEKELKYLKKLSRIKPLIDNIDNDNIYLSRFREILNSDNIENIEENIMKLLKEMNIEYNDKKDIIYNIDKLILEFKDQDNLIINNKEWIDIHFILNSDQYIPNSNIELSKEELEKIDRDYLNKFTEIYNSIEYVTDKKSFIEQMKSFVTDFYFAKLSNKSDINNAEYNFMENYIRQFLLIDDEGRSLIVGLKDKNIDNYLQAIKKGELNLLNDNDILKKHINNILKDSNVIKDYNKAIEERSIGSLKQLISNLEYRKIIESLIGRNNLDNVLNGNKDILSLNKIDITDNFTLMLISKMNQIIENINRINSNKRELTIRQIMSNTYNRFKNSNGTFKAKVDKLNILNKIKDKLYYSYKDIENSEHMYNMLSNMYNFIKENFIKSNNISNRSLINNINLIFNELTRMVDNIDDVEKFIKDHKIDKPYIRYKLDYMDFYLDKLIFNKDKMNIKINNWYIIKDNSFSNYSIFNLNSYERNIRNIENKVSLDSIISATSNSYLKIKKYSKNWQLNRYRHINNKSQYLMIQFITNKHSNKKNKLNYLFENLNNGKIDENNFDKAVIDKYSTIMKMDNSCFENTINILKYNKDFRKRFIDLYKEEFEQFKKHIKNINEPLIYNTFISFDNINNNNIMLKEWDKNNNSDFETIFIISQLFDIDKNNIVEKEQFKKEWKTLLKNNIDQVIKAPLEVIKNNNELLKEFETIKNRIEEKERILYENYLKQNSEKISEDLKKLRLQNDINSDFVEVQVLKELKKGKEIINKKEFNVNTFNYNSNDLSFIYIKNENNIDVKLVEKGNKYISIYDEKGIQYTFDKDNFNRIYNLSDDNLLYNSLDDVKNSLIIDKVTYNNKSNKIKDILSNKLQSIGKIIEMKDINIEKER